MDELPNIRHLRVFMEVARCHSVSGAAKLAHLSQPAVTQAVSKLEQEFGAPLFQRLSDGMLPTAIGSAFLARVKVALDYLETGAREMIRISRRAVASENAAGTGRSGSRIRQRRLDHLFTATQLRALVALSEAGNFSVAARRIGVSQPSIHRAARNLESIAGMPLFNASAEGVDLTPAATLLALYTRLALAELQQGRDEVADLLGHDSGLIRIGSLPLARTSILPEAVDALISETQGVQVQVVDGSYSELLNRLRHGELDFLIGALRYPPPADDVEQEVLFKDPLAIVAGANHPLAKDAQIPIENTLDYPWIAPPRSTPAGTYLFEKLRIQDMPKTPVRVVSSSLILLRGLLATGNYITIISVHQVRHELESGLFVTLDVKLDGSERAIGLTFRRDWRPTPSQARLLDLVRMAARPVSVSENQ